MNQYYRFADEHSNFIFSCLKQWEWGRREEYLLKLSLGAYRHSTGKDFIKVMSSSKGKKTVLFGNGAIAHSFCNICRLAGITLDFYTTNNSTFDAAFHEVPYISVENIKKNIGEYRFIIATSIPSYIDQISDQLLKLGALPEDIIFRCTDMGRQYFDLAQLTFTQEEVFVDAGSFNGDDVLRFIDQTGGEYNRIYSFEPDLQNYDNCVKRIGQLRAVEIVKAGVWSSSREISFSNQATGSSCVEESKGDTIKVYSMDDYIKNDHVTYIKMDIEGSELEAIKGAKNIIQRCRPKLAICVYHKPNDIYEIPKYLMEIAPFYKLYLRHYSIGELETVLYAIPDDESEISL